VNLTINLHSRFASTSISRECGQQFVGRDDLVNEIIRASRVGGESKPAYHLDENLTPQKELLQPRLPYFDCPIPFAYRQWALCFHFKKRFMNHISHCAGPFIGIRENIFICISAESESLRRASERKRN
jgi:hypothetical protein